MAIRADVLLFGGSVFASIVLTLIGSSKKESGSPTNRNPYVTMKWVTRLLDYALMGGALLLMDHLLVGEAFNPQSVYILQVSTDFGLVFVDMFKGLLFWPLVATAKTEAMTVMARELLASIFTLEGIRRSLSFLQRLLCLEGTLHKFAEGKEATTVHHHLWYFVKLGLFWIPVFLALQVKLGLLVWTPLSEVVAVIPAGVFDIHVTTLTLAYIEFVIIGHLKDYLSMHVVHQMLHSVWYSHHETHHFPKKSLSMLNVWYFDVLDLIAENSIGPMMLVAIKALGGGTCHVHFASVFLLTICDASVHSLDPYTVCLFNPLLEMYMRPALSHNLHHALNMGHFTIWPLHHIVGVSGPMHKGAAVDGVAYDIDQYNKVLGTSFPVDV